MDQMYGFKINDHQLFFPQAYGTEFNYCPSLDLSADNLADQGHIPGIQDIGYSFRLMEQDVYWKQYWGLRVLHWLPSSFYLRKTDVEADAPVLWPPDAKSWLIGKDPDAGKEWGQEEQGLTEDEMVGWHHQLSGQEFEQTLGDSNGQGSLVC